MSFVLSKAIAVAYGLSIGVAVVSDAVLAAGVAGACGLTGIVLQLVFAARQGRIERDAEAARAQADHTAGRVTENVALLAERKAEVERLSRRVEQLIAVLVAQGRTIPDERAVDIGPPDGERRS